MLLFYSNPLTGPCSVEFSALYCYHPWDDQTGGTHVGVQEGRWGVQRAGLCGTQSSTGIPLGTAVLETSALLPFPRESVQLAVIFSYLFRK